MSYSSKKEETIFSQSVDPLGHCEGTKTAEAIHSPSGGWSCLRQGQSVRRTSAASTERRLEQGRISTPHRKAAFTLAEVLITLGIIGVVAALTLPTLIANINDKVTENQVKVFNAKFIKGLNLTKTAGDMNDTYSSTYDFLQNALSKNLKMAKICSSDNLRDCIPYDKIKYDTKSGEEKTVDVSSLKTAKNLNIKEAGFKDTAAFVLADGTPVILSYNTTCTVDPDKADTTISSCVAGLYDINGTRKPNKFANKISSDGKNIETGDWRSFNSASIGSSCVGEIAGLCIVGTAKETNDDMFAAIQKVDASYKRPQNDNWQMGNDYCEKIAGGRLPTTNELGLIAQALYGLDKPLTGDEYKDKLSWDDNKDTVFAALGITGVTDRITLWSSEAIDASNAHHRIFWQNSSGPYWSDARSGYPEYHYNAVCIE